LQIPPEKVQYPSCHPDLKLQQLGAVIRGELFSFDRREILTFEPTSTTLWPLLAETLILS